MIGGNNNRLKFLLFPLILEFLKTVYIIYIVPEL